MSVRQEKLKNRCIQLGKKAIKEAYLDLYNPFYNQNFKYFCQFHNFVPAFFLIITTSTFPFLLLPFIFYFYLISSTSTKSNSTTYLTPVPTPKGVISQNQ